VTLDELLEGRDALTRFLEQNVAPKAATWGVLVDRVGVKDVVLPGEMKTLLNRVIEAEKSAAANVILRREETAATRSLVNTARLMADQPILLRLKELEALKDIASRPNCSARQDPVSVPAVPSFHHDVREHDVCGAVDHEPIAAFPVLALLGSAPGLGFDGDRRHAQRVVLDLRPHAR